MSDAPGAVAKAFLDALPTLDFKKLVEDARRQLSIVVVGDSEPAERIIDFLRAGGDVPADSRLQIWRHVPGQAGPADAVKPDLILAIPATEEHLAAVRTAFSAVPLIPIVIAGSVRDSDVPNAIIMPSLERALFRRLLVPRITTALWERRLALGRGLPATRRHIGWRITQTASKDPRVLLGSVAGAGAGRTGAPTAATAQLLMHQAALIVAVAAISGSSLDDKAAIFKRAASTLVPTLLLDGAEAGISRLATGGDGRKHGKLYGQVAAYVARPALSASSTLLAGALAGRAFRESHARPSVLSHTRRAGKMLVVGAGQSAAVAAAAIGSRLRLPGRARPAQSAPESAEPPPAPDRCSGAREDADGAGQP